MTGLTVEKKRIVIKIEDMEDWEVKALQEEIAKMLKLHEMNRKIKEGEI